jgi:hypothetical protein
MSKVTQQHRSKGHLHTVATLTASPIAPRWKFRVSGVEVVVWDFHLCFVPFCIKHLLPSALTDTAAPDVSRILPSLVQHIE